MSFAPFNRGGLLDMVLPSPLDPQDRASAQQHTLMNFGLGLLAQSGPSTTPVSLGQAIGRSGLQALGAMSQYEQDLLRTKLIKAKLIEDNRRQQAEEKLRQLVGAPGQTYKPGEGQGALQNIPASGYIGALERGDPNATRNLYANMAGLGGEYTNAALSGIAAMNKPGEGFTLSPGQVRYDAAGRPIASGGIDPEQARKDSEKQFQNANVLRDEYNNLTKEFRTVRDNYSGLIAATKNPSAAGDLSLLFSYYKLIDPNSVVRESEFAQAAASGSLGDRWVGVGKQLMSGERLADPVRQDFVNQATALYQEREAGYNQVRSQYGELAKRAKVNPADVLTEFRTPKSETPKAGGSNMPANLYDGAEWEGDGYKYRVFGTKIYKAKKSK